MFLLPGVFAYCLTMQEPGLNGKEEASSTSIDILRLYFCSSDTIINKLVRRGISFDPLFQMMFIAFCRFFLLSIPDCQYTTCFLLDADWFPPPSIGSQRKSSNNRDDTVTLKPRLKHFCHFGFDLRASWLSYLLSRPDIHPYMQLVSSKLSLIYGAFYFCLGRRKCAINSVDNRNNIWH
jgi:hypothetical protein